MLAKRLKTNHSTRSLSACYQLNFLSHFHITTMVIPKFQRLLPCDEKIRPHLLNHQSTLKLHSCGNQMKLDTEHWRTSRKQSTLYIYIDQIHQIKTKRITNVFFDNWLFCGSDPIPAGLDPQNPPPDHQSAGLDPQIPPPDPLSAAPDPQTPLPDPLSAGPDPQAPPQTQKGGLDPQTTPPSPLFAGFPPIVKLHHYHIDLEYFATFFTFLSPKYQQRIEPYLTMSTVTILLGSKKKLGPHIGNCQLDFKWVL